MIDEYSLLYGQHDGPGFMSRDRALPVISCQVLGCPANTGQGACNMPSCIRVNAAGQCELGQESMRLKREHAENLR